MKTRTCQFLSPFLLLFVAISAGCSGAGTEGSGTSSSGLPTDLQQPAPPGSNLAAGATVVYSENDSSLSAVGADGQRRMAIADNAAYQGATEDGWVVFLDGDALTSVRIADGTVRILDDRAGFKWFRGVFDTNYVVYQLQAGDESSVHVVRADGTDRLTPVPAQPRSVELVAITPARRVLFQVCDPVAGDDGFECTNHRLLSATLDGSDERVVLSGWPLIRHVTADDLLVFDRDTDAGTVVSVVRSDGSGSRGLDEAESFFAGALPNGRIVYNRREYGQLDLYSVAPDGTGRRELARSNEDEVFAGAAPDGRVLFRRGAPDAWRLYSVDEATGDIRTLQVAGSSNVRAVTPDGTVVVSARFGAGAQTQDDLYSVRADGSALRAIADSGDMEWFEAVAPDGRVIYMRCIPAPSGPCGDPGAQSDLYSVRQDATGTVGLATSETFETMQAVTQDNLVVYRRHNGGQSDLYSVPTTGGSAQPLADTESDERFMTLIEPGAAGGNPG